jgi:hypothetical protein
MNDVRTYEDVPEFSPDGTKTKPGAAKYANGFVEGEMCPFDYANWLWGNLTGNAVDEQSDINSMLAELKGILSLHGVSINPAVTNQLSGVLARHVYGDNARSSTLITDANNPVKSGFYSLATPFTHGPTGAAYHIIHIQASGSDSFAIQIASLTTGNNTYVRTNNNGTWTAWAKLWNADNDGAGSGLNAEDSDKLDGYHAGHADGDVPVSDGTVNTNMNSDMVDGYHAHAEDASTIPIRAADKTVKGPIRTRGYLHGATVTDGDIFTALSAYIPNVGDSINITGAAVKSGSTASMSRAVRFSSTRIDIYFCNSAGVGFFTGTSGGSTNQGPLTMAW